MSSLSKDGVSYRKTRLLIINRKLLKKKCHFIAADRKRMCIFAPMFGENHSELLIEKTRK